MKMFQKMSTACAIFLLASAGCTDGLDTRSSSSPSGSFSRNESEQDEDPGASKPSSVAGARLFCDPMTETEYLCYVADQGEAALAAVKVAVKFLKFRALFKDTTKDSVPFNQENDYDAIVTLTKDQVGKQLEEIEADFELGGSVQVLSTKGNPIEEEEFSLSGPIDLEFALGQESACMKFVDGKVKCWGANDGPYIGMLGLGDNVSRGLDPLFMGAALPYVNLSSAFKIRQMSAGVHSFCALLENGTVKCWGSASTGELGNESMSGPVGDQPVEMGDSLGTVNLGTNVHVKQLFKGRGYHHCAVLEDDTLKCWGRNQSGQLGLGDLIHRGLPISPSMMGDALPKLNLGTNRKVKAGALGVNHSCAILDNNDLKCWGENSYGQLGLGDTVIRGGGALQMGDALAKVELGSGRYATQVSLGDSHTCAVLDDQSLKCWGSNSSGKLGLGDTSARGDGLDMLGNSEMGDNLPTVILGVSNEKAAYVSLGDEHSCVLLTNGGVKCWGANTECQLGLGLPTYSTIGTFIGQMATLLPLDFGGGVSATAMQSGSNYSCAQMSTGGFSCWGSNTYGKLGRGISSTRVGCTAAPITPHVSLN